MLDIELEKRGHRFIRYADDFIIFVKSKRAGERVKESITDFLETKLDLTINEKKSKICGATSATFLGFNLQNLMGKSDADLVSRRNNDSKQNLKI